MTDKQILAMIETLSLRPEAKPWTKEMVQSVALSVAHEEQEAYRKLMDNNIALAKLLESANLQRDALIILRDAYSEGLKGTAAHKCEDSKVIFDTCVGLLLQKYEAHEAAAALNAALLNESLGDKAKHALKRLNEAILGTSEKPKCEHKWVVPFRTDLGPGSVCEKCETPWLPGLIRPVEGPGSPNE